jgi:hypothetical protein
MKPGQHFLLSFLSAIIVPAAMVSIAFVFEEKISELMPAPLAMLVIFIGGHFIVRGIFHSYVKVNCLQGCGRKAGPIKGRHDRFRCNQCGMDF